MTAIDKTINIGLNIHVREWAGEKPPFVLVHGLASNARLWDKVGDYLAAEGHRVIAIDQRGHGLSDKPDGGYDFETVTADLKKLLDTMELERPYLAGQSWGGNVMLAFGVHYPAVARGLAFVDGGTIDIQADPEATWEIIKERMKPPSLIGLPRAEMRGYIQQGHPEWEEWAIEAILANFETMPNSTIRPWLTLERHLKILHELWLQRPPELYPHVHEPVLIALADDGNAVWVERKKQQAQAAAAGLPNAEIHWFHNTPHDIHVDKPEELAQLMLAHDKLSCT
ncbi:MAG: alpha/beta hydrolase [Anaerolineales bacterium]|nr:alpha/beta hydrolase [Anaerolineales bacterium]